MEYYLPPAPPEGMPAFDGILDENAAHIPKDEGNRHWMEYQAWLAEGNEAKPYPEGGLPIPVPSESAPEPAPEAEAPKEAAAPAPTATASKTTTRRR